MGFSIQKILTRYPSLTRDAILAAWEYAEANRTEIDNDIRANEET